MMIAQEQRIKYQESAIATRRSVLSAALDRVIFTDLLATTVCVPLAYGTVEDWSIALFELNALALAVLLAFRLTLDARNAWRLHRLMLPLAALVLFGALQAVPFKAISPDLSAPESQPLQQLGPPTLSLDPQATRGATIKLLALAIYFFVAVNTLSERRRRQITFKVLTGLGSALAVLAILQRLTWNGKIYWVRPLGPDLLAFGPFVNPNHFAGMMELIVPVAFAHLLLARLDAGRRALWFFATVIMAASVVLSLSRGGMVALGVELLAFYILAVARGRSRSGAAWAPLAVGAVVVIALWVGYDQVAARWQAVGQGRGEISVAKRLEIWRDSWRMVREHPLWGVGLGAFPTAYPSYGRSSARRERLEETHNDYLQLLTDGGAVGGAVGLWFLIELMMAAKRQWRAASGASRFDRALVAGSYVAVLGLAVHSFTDFNLQITANALLFLLVIALTTSLEATATLARSTPQETTR